MFVLQFLEVIVISTIHIVADGVPVIVKLSVVLVTVACVWVKKTADPAGVSGLAFTTMETPADGTFVKVMANEKSGPVAGVCKVFTPGIVVAETVACPTHGSGVPPPPPPLFLQPDDRTIEPIINRESNRKMDFIIYFYKGSN